MKLRVEGIFDRNWAEVEGDLARIYGQNFSERSGREYGRKLIKTVTREKAEQMAAALVAKEQKAKADRLTAEAKKISRAEALAKLAGEYSGLTLTKNGEVKDQYGNYLFGLPHEIPENVGQWIARQMREMMEAYDD
jgi:tRNA A37 N6-isopentenylltransferase MiaA